MKNKITVAVGICAYNEQRKIRKVLEDVLLQSHDNWELKEILIYSDGSTDNTVSEAEKVKSRLIKVYAERTRAGKTVRLQEMFGKASADILITLDADIRLSDNRVISNLVRPFLEDKTVMLTGGNSMPYPPKSFFEKAVYTTFLVFYKSRKRLKMGHNIFGCTGSVLGLRKEFFRQIKFPKIVNEDAYLYLYCLANGFKFFYVDRAVVRYELPKNITDYIRQVFRSEPASVAIELQRFFGSLAKKECRRPLGFYLKSVFEVFLLNPIGVIYITLVNLLCRPFIPLVIRNYKLDWFTAHSTH